MPSSACDWSSDVRSEEHTSELQSHSEISYAVFCLKQKKLREKSKLHNTCYFKKLINKSKFSIHVVLLDFIVSGFVEIKGSTIFFFFNDTATTEIYTNLNTLSLHDALPI